MLNLEQLKRMREKAWRYYNRFLELYRAAEWRKDRAAAMRYFDAAFKAYRHYSRRSAAYVRALNGVERRVLFVRSEVRE